MFSPGLFKQQVHFAVSCCFIAVFGIFMTFQILELADMENPIVGSGFQSTTDIGFQDN